MRFLRTLRPSLRALLAYRTRSLLAASGVAVGIAAVFLTSAIGAGAQAELLGDLGAMGTRLLVVRPAQIKRSTARKDLRGFVSSLKLEDAKAIGELPRIEAVAPSVEGPARVKTARGVVATQVLGTTSAFFRARHLEVGQGRLFDEEEEGGATRIAVLGGRLARSLFPAESALGQVVRIGGVGFEVIGVLALKGVSADGAQRP